MYMAFQLTIHNISANDANDNRANSRGPVNKHARRTEHAFPAVSFAISLSPLTAVVSTAAEYACTPVAVDRLR